MLFWGQCYVVSDSMCCCVWSHFVVFGDSVLCCDLKLDWEHMLWLRTLCSVFWCCNHSTNNAPSNSITAEIHHPNKLQIFYIRHRSINNKWNVYNSLLQSPLWYKAAVWLDHLSWRLKRRQTICWAGAFSAPIWTVPWGGRALPADTNCLSSETEYRNIRGRTLGLEKLT